MFQNKIEESVYNLIKSQAERFGVAHKFNFLKSKIICKTTGSEILFYGLARNIDEIKSLEGIDILWMEEAHALTAEMWEILEPTIIRNEGSEVWVIFNPRLASDFAYKRFVVNPPAGYIVRKINYDENPWLPVKTVETIAALKKNEPDEYKHVYGGVPRNDDDKAIIKRTWLDSAVDAHKKLGITPTGAHRIGFDVADDGSDLNAQVKAYGVLCDFVEKWKGLEDELLKSATRVYKKAIETGSSVDYDSIGVGAMAGSKFKELNEVNKTEMEYRQFNAGGKIIDPDKEYMPNVKNKDHFSNIKAQSWWNISARLLKTHMWVTTGEACDPNDIISISSDVAHLEELLTELSTPHRDFDQSGKVKVESKKDLAKRDVKSPNLADAFIMAYTPFVAPPKGINWAAMG